MLPEGLEAEEPLEEDERRDDHEFLAVNRPSQREDQPSKHPLNKPRHYHCRYLAQSSMKTVVFLR